MIFYLLYVVYLASFVSAVGHIGGAGLAETVTPSWDNQDPCVQAILDYTIYQQYDSKDNFERVYVCRSLLSSELGGRLYQRAVELASALEECALADNHHITAEVLLVSYCHSQDGEALTSAHTEHPEPVIPSEEMPQLPLIDIARVTEPVNFKHALGKCQLSRCALGALEDLEWLAVISLGYASRSHLCFPRNTIPGVLLREAKLRARACADPDDSCSLIAMLQSYCSSDMDSFHTDLDTTTTVYTTTTLTMTAANSATPIIPLCVLEDGATFDTETCRCSSVFEVFKNILITLGPITCLAAVLGGTMQFLVWQFMVYRSDRTNHAGAIASHEDENVFLVDDLISKPSPHLRFNYRIYLLSCLLGGATFCLVIWVMHTQTRWGPYLNPGLYGGCVSWMLQAAAAYLANRRLENGSDQSDSTEKGENADV